MTEQLLLEAVIVARSDIASWLINWRRSIVIVRSVRKKAIDLFAIAPFNGAKWEENIDELLDRE
jgi:hypothetical protein